MECCLYYVCIAIYNVNYKCNANVLCIVHDYFNVYIIGGPVWAADSDGSGSKDAASGWKFADALNFQQIDLGTLYFSLSPETFQEYDVEIDFRIPLEHDGKHFRCFLFTCFN